MRFDTPIYFQSVINGSYNENTGNYEEDELVEVRVYASISSSDIATLQAIYGEIKQGSFVLKVQRPYTKPFDNIRIGEKVYKADHIKSKNRVFIVSEVK